MNSPQLAEYFDRVSEAPDAIPRLRSFILDLAVRGKLVVQDPSDETALALLKRIQEEKQRLVAQRKIRSPGALDTNSHNDNPFSIPTSWVWCQLYEIGSIVGGGTPPSSDLDNFAPPGSEIAWLTPADLGKRRDLYISHGARDLTAKGLKSSSATIMPKGSVLFTSRAPIGYTAIALNDISTNQGFKSVVPYIPECNLYLAVYFRAFGKWIDDKAFGTTFREVSGKIVARLPFPLPPLAEQHRIVAKVDELMEFCDHLEAAQRGREVRRDRLAATSLHHLSDRDNATDLPAPAHFCLDHLPQLTVRHDQIPALRQAILSLAVQGKLVQQTPEDGSAESILSKVRDIREKAANRSKNSSVDDSDPKFFQHLPKNLPPGWVACPLEELFRFIDYRGRTPTRTTRGVRLITAKNVRMGHVANDPVEYIDEGAYKKWMSRGFPENGDLLFVTEGATMGYVGTIELQFVFALAQRTIDLQPYLRSYARFFFFTLMSPIFQEAVVTNATGTAVKGIKAAKLKRIRVPLPPLAEQERIVAKVDELMALCDRLEALLTTSQTEASRLLESVLYHALRDFTPEAMATCETAIRA